MASLSLGATLQDPPDPPPPPPPPRPRPVAPPPLPPPAIPAPRPAAAPPTATRPPPQRGTATPREAQTSARQEPSAAPPGGQAVHVAVTPGFEGGGQDGKQGDGQQAGLAPTAAAAGDQFDSDLLLDLLPTDGDSGIFEVLLPNGDRLGVMVDVGRGSASFLLSPGSDQLRDWLRRKKMELQTGLMRRMSRPVRLAVL